MLAQVVENVGDVGDAAIGPEIRGDCGLDGPAEGIGQLDKLSLKEDPAPVFEDVMLAAHT